MAKRSRSSRNGQSIVAPGVKGGEEFLPNLVRAISERGLRAVAHEAARTRDAKALIEDVVQSVNGLNSSLQAEDATTFFMSMYASCVWVYVAIRQIATNLAVVPLCVEQQQADGKYEAVPDHEAQAVLDAPRTRHSTADMVEQATTYLETCGSGLVVVERENGDSSQYEPNKPIVGFTPLRPSQVTIIPDQRAPNGVGLYQYLVDGRTINIDPRNADFQRYFNPLNDWWGLAPVSVVQNIVAIDKSLENYNQATLDNGGVPDLVLETEQAVTRANARRITREFEQKHMRAGKAGGVVLLDGGLTVKPVGLPPKDMQFPETSEFTEQRILAAFGVPPILAMDMSDASVLANADVQVKLFFKFTLKRTARVQEESLTRQVRRDFNDQKLRVRFAFERADATHDADKERDSVVKGYDSGVVTRNEARKALGLDPVEDGGDEFKAPAPSPFGGGDQLPNQQGKTFRKPRLQASAEFKAVARLAYARQHDAATERLRRPMKAFFKTQRRRVLDRFDALKPELGIAGGIPHVQASAAPGEAKALAGDAIMSKLFNTLEESKLFVSEVGPVFLGGMVEAGNEKMHQLAPTTRLALKESHLPFQDFYSRWGATRVVDINDETRKAIQAAVQSGFDEGFSTREIEGRIDASFKDLVNVGAEDGTETDFPEYRLERIARTEAGTMLNKGSYEGVKDLVAHGSKVQKSWLSSRDNLVRDSHAQVDDETSDDPIPFTQLFSNGLQFPNDPDGPAEEVINCRCSLIEEVLNEDEEA